MAAEAQTTQPIEASQLRPEVKQEDRRNWDAFIAKKEAELASDKFDKSKIDRSGKSQADVEFEEKDIDQRRARIEAQIDRIKKGEPSGWDGVAYFVFDNVSTAREIVQGVRENFKPGETLKKGWERVKAVRIREKLGAVTPGSIGEVGKAIGLGITDDLRDEVNAVKDAVRHPVRTFRGETNPAAPAESPTQPAVETVASTQPVPEAIPEAVKTEITAEIQAERTGNGDEWYNVRRQETIENQLDQEYPHWLEEKLESVTDPTLRKMLETRQMILMQIEYNALMAAATGYGEKRKSAQQKLDEVEKQLLSTTSESERTKLERQKKKLQQEVSLREAQETAMSGNAEKLMKEMVALRHSSARVEALKQEVRDQVAQTGEVKVAGIMDRLKKRWKTLATVGMLILGFGLGLRSDMPQNIEDNGNRTDLSEATYGDQSYEDVFKEVNANNESPEVQNLTPQEQIYRQAREIQDETGTRYPIDFYQNLAAKEIADHPNDFKGFGEKTLKLYLSRLDTWGNQLQGLSQAEYNAALNLLSDVADFRAGEEGAEKPEQYDNVLSLVGADDNGDVRPEATALMDWIKANT